MRMTSWVVWCGPQCPAYTLSADGQTKLKAPGPTIHLPNLPDKGCDYHRPSCFSCPYSDCLHDMDQERRSRDLLRIKDRGAEDREIVARFEHLVAQGMDRTGAMARIAAFYGVQMRTAYRRVSTARQRLQVRE